MDIMKICCPFWMLIWTSIIDHFTYSLGGEGGWNQRYFCEYYFIRVHENLEQHPSNNISII